MKVVFLQQSVKNYIVRPSRHIPLKIKSYHIKLIHYYLFAEGFQLFFLNSLFLFVDQITVKPPSNFSWNSLSYSFLKAYFWDSWKSISTIKESTWDNRVKWWLKIRKSSATNIWLIVLSEHSSSTRCKSYSKYWSNNSTMKVSGTVMNPRVIYLIVIVAFTH